MNASAKTIEDARRKLASVQSAAGQLQTAMRAAIGPGEYPLVIEIPPLLGMEVLMLAMGGSQANLDRLERQDIDGAFDGLLDCKEAPDGRIYAIVRLSASPSIVGSFPIPEQYQPFFSSAVQGRA